MTAQLLAWLAANEGPWAYLVLVFAALVEYIFPPFPGDSLALFGVVLGLRAGYSAPLVFIALNVGALIGGLASYALGRALDEPSKRPRWLRAPASEAAIQKLVAHYREHGALYLAANRFVPALRAFFFIAAGVARVPLHQVVLYGGASALAWNAMLFLVGSALGANFDRLQRAIEGYGLAFAALALALAAIALFVRLRRARRQP